LSIGFNFGAKMSSDTVTITPEILEQKIQSSVPGCTYVRAVDQSDGCGAKFEIIVRISSPRNF
jgi:hypothetical protein